MLSYSEDEFFILKSFLEKTRGQPVSDEEIHGLLCRFGSLCGVVESGRHMLEKAGLNRQEAQLLSLIPELTRYVQRDENGSRPKLDRLASSTGYLQSLFLGVHIERFYALCLNDGGRLLSAKMLQQGTFDESPFYLDALLKRVIDDNATAVILTHNHPAGSLYPSEADLVCTNRAQNALTVMDVCLLDHVIVADGQCVSLRQNGYMVMPELQNMRAAGLCQHWLDGL